MCGYSEKIMGNKVHTIMNEYVNASTKKVICVNNDINQFDSVDAEGIVKATWILKSVYEKTSTTSGAAPVPSSPATPPTIVNRLDKLPPSADLTTKPVVQLTPETVQGVETVTPPAEKPNPFAGVKAPVPNGGPI